MTTKRFKFIIANGTSIWTGKVGTFFFRDEFFCRQGVADMFPESADKCGLTLSRKITFVVSDSLVGHPAGSTVYELKWDDSLRVNGVPNAYRFADDISPQWGTSPWSNRADKYLHRKFNRADTLYVWVEL
jgi:hypothetical protein